MKTFSMPCRDIEALQPLAQEACKLFLDECKKQGLNIFITQTLRTAEYQNSLYQQGRTKSGNIVTNCDGYKSKSNHQGGLAWDVACRGSNLYDASILRKCGAVAKQLGITWGGGWTIGDTPHFQIEKGWKSPVKNLNMQESKLPQAIDILIKKGVQIDKNVWSSQDTMKLQFAEGLISKIGNKLYGTDTYSDTIKALKTKGIITQDTIWINKQFKANYVEALLIKIASNIK